MGQASERGTLRRSDSEHISLSRNVVIACPTATVTGSRRQKRKLALSRREPTRRPRERAPALKPEPEIPATAYDAERLTHAKLLHELMVGECCWPLNTGGPLLPNHTARSLPEKNKG